MTRSVFGRTDRSISRQRLQPRPNSNLATEPSHNRSLDIPESSLTRSAPAYDAATSIRKDMSGRRRHPHHHTDHSPPRALSRTYQRPGSGRLGAAPAATTIVTVRVRSPAHGRAGRSRAVGEVIVITLYLVIGGATQVFRVSVTLVRSARRGLLRCRQRRCGLRRRLLRPSARVCIARTPSQAIPMAQGSATAPTR